MQIPRGIKVLPLQSKFWQCSALNEALNFIYLVYLGLCYIRSGQAPKRRHRGYVADQRSAFTMMTMLISARRENNDVACLASCMGCASEIPTEYGEYCTDARKSCWLR